MEWGGGVQTVQASLLSPETVNTLNSRVFSATDEDCFPQEREQTLPGEGRVAEKVRGDRVVKGGGKKEGRVGGKREGRVGGKRGE